MSSRRRLALGLGAGLLAAAGIAVAGPWRVDLWRAAYPHLPRQVQAAPYRLAGLARDDTTPVPLPTPAVAFVATASPTTLPSLDTAPTALQRRATAPTGLQSPSPAPESPPTPASVPTPALPPAAQVAMGPHEYQTWNNCGPATVSMALAAIQRPVGQAEAARHLKPDPDDKNVGPDELAAYARSLGLGATVRVNGTLESLKGLVADGHAVIVEVWFVPDPGDEMGHYILVRGYDDAEGSIQAFDSYHGPAVRMAYADFDRDWRVFNRTFVVVFPPERAAEVEARIGPEDPARLFTAAAATALAEIQSVGDAFAWFNLGSSLVAAGDTRGAADAFDRARALGLPWRMLWYQHGPYRAYGAEGRWDDVESLARASLANAPNLEESQLWLGHALAARGDVEGARAAWSEALRLNPNFTEAAEALAAP